MELTHYGLYCDVILDALIINYTFNNFEPLLSHMRLLLSCFDAV